MGKTKNDMLELLDNIDSEIEELETMIGGMVEPPKDAPDKLHRDYKARVEDVKVLKEAAVAVCNVVVDGKDTKACTDQIKYLLLAVDLIEHRIEITNRQIQAAETTKEFNRDDANWLVNTVIPKDKGADVKGKNQSNKVLVDSPEMVKLKKDFEDRTKGQENEQKNKLK